VFSVRTESSYTSNMQINFSLHMGSRVVEFVFLRNTTTLVTNGGENLLKFACKFRLRTDLEEQDGE